MVHRVILKLLEFCFLQNACKKCDGNFLGLDTKVCGVPHCLDSKLPLLPIPVETRPFPSGNKLVPTRITSGESNSHTKPAARIEEYEGVISITKPQNRNGLLSAYLIRLGGLV